MSASVSVSKAQPNPLTGAAAPPSAAEVQRKLSMHAPAVPHHRRRGSVSKSAQPALSGTESDSDASVTFSPPTRHQPLANIEASGSVQAGQGPALNAMQCPQLEAIAEKSGSGEDTEDDEDDDWDPERSKIREESVALDNVVKSGYLQKKGERRKTWKKRWFVLRQTQLSYYKSNKEYQSLRVVPLSEIHSVSQVTLKRHEHTFGIVTPSRTYYIQADSARAADDWVRTINDTKAKLAVTAAPSADAKKHVPPAINVQRSGTIDAHAAGNQTPPPQHQISASPSPPQYLSYHLTSSDSEDHDGDVLGPTTPGTSPQIGGATVQFAAERDPKKIILQGYLMKCGSQRRRWRKRWFVLTPEQLMYAKSHMEVVNGKPSKSVKVVPLDAILDAIECAVPKHAVHGLGGALDKAITTGESIRTSMSLPGNGLNGNSATNPVVGAAASPPGGQLQHPATQSSTESSAGPLPHTFRIITPKRPLILCAPSEDEEIKWMSAVRALIARRSGANPTDQYVPAPTAGPSILQNQPVVQQSNMAGSTSPNSKRTSRREGSGSFSSSNTPTAEQTMFSQPGSHIIAPRKDAASLTGIVANARIVPTSSA